MRRRRLWCGCSRRIPKMRFTWPEHGSVMTEQMEEKKRDAARTWTRPHLLDLESLSAQEIIDILDTAHSLKEVSTRSIKKIPALRGKVMVNLFFEDSTRTKTSFSLAAQRLSADIIDFS